jgi:hypothetical protein
MHCFHGADLTVALRHAGLPRQHHTQCALAADAAEEAWQRQHNEVISALAGAGLVSLGEPCAAECAGGAATCAACMLAHALEAPPPPNCSRDNNAAQQPPADFKVPWL